jgi:VWFA-related protein
MRRTSVAAAIFATGLVAAAGFSGVPAAKSAAKDSAKTAPAFLKLASGRAIVRDGANGAPLQEAGQQPLTATTSVVNVFATVRDKKHGIISDLTKEDFKIFEDGQEQKIAFFSKEVDMPITLGLLIDTSASMDRIIDAEQDTASRFLREVMRPKDEAMVITFDFDVDLLADFTSDTSVLSRAIRSARVNSVGGGGVVTPGTIPGGQGGGTNLYDAIYLATHDELATQAGRKGVIVMTDAEDTGSKLRLQDAIEAAQRSDAVIHVMLITDRMATFGSGPGVARKMADDTGGRVIEVRNEGSLEKAFDEISQELRSQYVLGYYPTNLKRDGTFRKIQVDVTRPDSKILARKGYYAPFK